LTWIKVGSDFSDVRFGSKADICSAPTHVCFTPNSDRESGLPEKVMSALPPKADMCGANGHVCFGPIGDIAHRLGCLAGAFKLDIGNPVALASAQAGLFILALEG
jgi:hypothetical protein